MDLSKMRGVKDEDLKRLARFPELRKLILNLRYYRSNIGRAEKAEKPQ